MATQNKVLKTDTCTDKTLVFGYCDANMVVDALLRFQKHDYVRVNITDTPNFEVKIQYLRNLLVQEKETLLAQNPKVTINTDFTFESTALWLRLDDDCEWSEDYAGDTEIEISPYCTVCLGKDRGYSLEYLTVVWEHEPVAPDVVLMYLRICDAQNYVS